jgi:hypothetical protein
LTESVSVNEESQLVCEIKVESGGKQGMRSIILILLKKNGSELDLNDATEDKATTSDSQLACGSKQGMRSMILIILNILVQSWTSMGSRQILEKKT